MDEFIYSVGMIVPVLGAIAIIIALLLFVWWGLSCIWIAASNKFRGICKADDVAPVVHCHRVDDGCFWDHCSECGADLLYGANYCYSCGAKIDGADG